MTKQAKLIIVLIIAVCGFVVARGRSVPDATQKDSGQSSFTAAVETDAADVPETSNADSSREYQSSNSEGANNNTPGVPTDNLTLENTMLALETQDAAFFASLRASPQCTQCSAIFANLRGEFLLSPTNPPKLKLLADALAQSERPELVADVIAQYREASADPAKQAILAEALAEVSGDAQVSQVLAPLLSADEPGDLREAALTGISGLSDTVAAEALLQYARRLNDGKGGYEEAAGLGEFVPSPDAVPLLQRVAAEKSLESPLAIKALFNGGVESTKQAFETLSGMSDEAEQRRLLDGAQSHVLLEPATLDYLKNLMQKDGKQLSATLRLFLEEVLARDSQG